MIYELCMHYVINIYQDKYIYNFQYPFNETYCQNQILIKYKTIYLVNIRKKKK